MNVRLFEAAQRELDAAIAYYNAERPNLGDELLVEFLSIVERIKTYPNGWPSPPTNAATIRRRTSIGNDFNSATISDAASVEIPFAIPPVGPLLSTPVISCPAGCARSAAAHRDGA